LLPYTLTLFDTQSLNTYDYTIKGTLTPFLHVFFTAVQSFLQAVQANGLEKG